MKPNEETNDKTWTDQPWPGNPSLMLEASCKFFPYPYGGGKISVWVFGNQTDRPFMYCVSAGAYSDYSYSGGFYPKVIVDIEEAKKLVDQLQEDKKLIR